MVIEGIDDFFFIFILFIYFFSVFLSYIDMNQPWIYMRSPSRSPLPPPCPPDPPRIDDFCSQKKSFSCISHWLKNYSQQLALTEIYQVKKKLCGEWEAEHFLNQERILNSTSQTSCGEGQVFFFNIISNSSRITSRITK